MQFKTTWKELIRDSFLKTYENKEEFYNTNFINDLFNKVSKANLNLKQEMVCYEIIIEKWEHFFHQNRFCVIDRVLRKVKDFISYDDLKYVDNVELDWFCFIENKEKKEYDLDLLNTPDLFEAIHLLTFLTDEDLKKYRIDPKDMNNFIEKKNSFTDSVGYWDTRFFCVKSKNDYEESKEKWNQDIDKAIELAKHAN